MFWMRIVAGGSGVSRSKRDTVVCPFLRKMLGTLGTAEVQTRWICGAGWMGFRDGGDPAKNTEILRLRLRMTAIKVKRSVEG
jgi:hypothetical protein